MLLNKKGIDSHWKVFCYMRHAKLPKFGRELTKLKIGENERKQHKKILRDIRSHTAYHNDRFPEWKNMQYVDASTNSNDVQCVKKTK